MHGNKWLVDPSAGESHPIRDFADERSDVMIGSSRHRKKPARQEKSTSHPAYHANQEFNPNAEDYVSGMTIDIRDTV
jgi:hypothetical protein